MPGFRVLATHHTSFTVSDLERSIALFRDGLGLEVTSKGPRDPALAARVTGVPGAELLVAYLRGPGHSIELIQYLGPAEGRGRVEARPCDVGFAHLAYDVDDLDAALAALAAHGACPAGEVVVIDQGPNAGARLVYVRDPDGITIELIERPRAAPA